MSDATMAKSSPATARTVLITKQHTRLDHVTFMYEHHRIYNVSELQSAATNDLLQEATDSKLKPS